MFYNCNYFKCNNGLQQTYLNFTVIMRINNYEAMTYVLMDNFWPCFKDDTT